MFSNLFGNSQKPVERSAEDQQKVDAQTASLQLYHFDSCPYCARVRSHIEALALHIEQRDTRMTPGVRDELVAGGGKGQVPALRIVDENGDVQWMYESSDIMGYLSGRFA